MDYKSNIHCEVCGNKDVDKFSLKYTRADFQVTDCDVCGFSFIPQFYRKQIPYENYRDDEVLKSVRAGNNYIKFRRHKLRIKLIKKFQKTGKLYDVGVGWGHFLHTAQVLGFEASGVEISELMHHYATTDLKLNVVHDDFYNLELPENNWDVVTMWDVLEHISEPQKAVKKINKMLKKDGFFVLQVPQIDSKVAKKQKQNWSMMSIEHINYFSKKTIKTLLEDNGFEIVKIKSSYELKLFLKFTVLPWLKRKKTKKQDEKITITNAERQNFFNKFTKLPKFVIWLGLLAHDIVYKFMSAINYGEEMIVVAQKKNKDMKELKKTVIFDFDGTLADTLEVMLAIFNRIAPEYKCKQVEFSEKEKYLGLSIPELLKEVNVSMLLLPRLALRMKNELTKELHKVSAFPGIEESLHNLKEIGYSLGVMSSNSVKNINAFLKRNSLFELFDFIHSGKNIFGKDKVISRILSKYKIPKDSVVYVGDEHRDIEAVKKINIPIISVTWGLNSKELLEKHKPNLIISQVSELCKSVKEIIPIY